LTSIRDIEAACSSEIIRRVQNQVTVSRCSASRFLIYSFASESAGNQDAIRRIAARIALDRRRQDALSQNQSHHGAYLVTLKPIHQSSGAVEVCVSKRNQVANVISA